MTGNKTQRQWIGLSYRFATMLIALLFVAMGKMNAQTPYFKVNGTTLTFYSVDGNDTQGGTKISEWGTPKIGNSPEKNPAWITTYNQETITTVIFDASFANIKPTSCYDWFKSFRQLSEIKGIENLNTSSVTNMNGMFYECKNIEEINLSGFNTTQVTDMSGMFHGCEKIKKINTSSFNTSRVTDMSGMFNSCTALTQLDVSKLNTSNVTNFNQMFSGSTGLESLDLTNFNTSSGQTMMYVFLGCTNLKLLDLSSFNTSNVTTMEGMFMNCSNLTTIYASEAYNIDKVATESYMFSGCTKNLVGATQFNDKHTDVDMANNKNGYFMPYYEDKDGKHPIYENGVKKTISLHLYNQNPFYTQTTFDIDEGSYTRESMASDWGTVCVPFVTDVAKSNCTFYQLNNMGTDAIEISPISGEEILAGTPVIVKRNDGVKDLKVIAKACEIVADPVNGTMANHLEGTFQDQKVSKKCYFLAKNKFWYVGQIAEDGEIKGVHVYPFRAYLTCGDAAQQPNELNIMVKDETNSVESPVTVDSLFSNKAEYYDAAGRRIHTLQKGLNIVRIGGQSRKVMIK